MGSSLNHEGPRIPPVASPHEGPRTPLQFIRGQRSGWVGGFPVFEFLFERSKFAVEGQAAVGEVEAVGDVVCGFYPVGSKKGVPEDVAGVHFVGEQIFFGETRGAFHFATRKHAVFQGGPAGRVFEAHEVFDAVALPGDHMRTVHVVVGGGTGSADEDDGITAGPGESSGGQGFAPGVHNLFFKSVEELAGAVEVGQFEVRHLKLHVEGVFYRDFSEVFGDVGHDKLVTFGTGDDAGVRVVADFVNDLFDGRHVEGERDAVSGHEEVVYPVPGIAEFFPGGDGAVKS